MCVFACSLVADKANLSSELSKCKQSKSILKVMALVIPWLRDIFHLKPNLSYCASFAHLITLKTFFFNNSTCVHWNTCKLCKFERHAWPYPPCINCLLNYKMPYSSYGFDDAKLLKSGNPVSYADHTQLTMYYIWL